jgi:hypothetical protein
MTQDIIGIDVKVEFADGTIAQGHLSPIGPHIPRSAQGSGLMAVLEPMFLSVEDRFRPWKVKS